MKFIAVGDTHFGLRVGRTPTARNSFFQYVRDQFSKVVQSAISSKVDYFFHTGDIFNRSKPKREEIDYFYSQIEKLLVHGIKVVLVPGNHDRSSIPDSLLNYFYSGLTIANSFSIIETPEVFIYAFPYERFNPESIASKILDHQSSHRKPNLVLCHQTFRGSWFGPHQFVFHHGVDLFEPHWFSANTIVLTGHIHRAQQVSDSNVFYTGSLIRTSFAESIEPKGYLLGEIANNRLNLLFQNVESHAMQVIEINSHESLSSVKLRIDNSKARILLRFLNQPMTPSLRKTIDTEFPKSQFPFLQISPQAHTLLESLYNTSIPEFSPPIMQNMELYRSNTSIVKKVKL